MTRISPNPEDGGPSDTADNEPNQSPEKGETHREEAQISESSTGEETREAGGNPGDTHLTNGEDGATRVPAPGERFRQYLMEFTRSLQARRLKYRRAIVECLIGCEISLRTFRNLARFYREEEMDLVVDSRSRKGACRRAEECPSDVDREIEKDNLLDELDEQEEIIRERMAALRSLGGRALRCDRRQEIALRGVRQFEAKKKQKLTPLKKGTKHAKNLRLHRTRPPQRARSGVSRGFSRAITIVLARRSARRNEDPDGARGGSMTASEYRRRRVNSDMSRGGEGVHRNPQRRRSLRNLGIRLERPRRRPETSPEEHQEKDEAEEGAREEAQKSTPERERELDASKHGEHEQKRLDDHQGGSGGDASTQDGGASEKPQEKPGEKPEESQEFPGKKD